MDKKLLAILRCPVTHKGLSVARHELLETVNRAIGEGRLRNRDGEPVRSALKEALVTDDAKTLYPVADGIPVLLEGEGVALDQLDAG